MLRGRVCVALGGRDADAIAQAVHPIEDLVDVVEVRIDLMERPEIEACIARIDKPLLFTNRPDWEGGASTVPEPERIALLLRAAAAGAAYVDVELRTEESLRRKVLDARGRARVIMSRHYFDGTPPAEDLEKDLAEIIGTGADVGKIITTALCSEEVLAVFALQKKALALGFPLICFAMGPAGRVSRLATLYLGGYMSYAAVDQAEGTAPGQFSVTRLHQLMELFEQ